MDKEASRKKRAWELSKATGRKVCPSCFVSYKEGDRKIGCACYINKSQPPKG